MATALDLNRLPVQRHCRLRPLLEVVVNQESRRQRILVVDDEPLVAMLVEDMLIDMGFDVVGPALHLEKAFDLLESEAIDAAILDVNLGASRSYPLARWLAENDIPFAFATGYSSPAAGLEMQVPVLRKPFAPAALGRVMAQLLRNPFRTGDNLP